MLYGQWHKRRYLQVWAYQDNAQVVDAPLDISLVLRPIPLQHWKTWEWPGDEVTFGLE